MLRDYHELDKIVLDPYLPCIKYKNPADPKLDGTDYFIVAESMHLQNMRAFGLVWLNCSLSFACERDHKAFYKIIQDCLRFRINEESFCDLRKHSWFSLILGILYE